MRQAAVAVAAVVVRKRRRVMFGVGWLFIRVLGWKILPMVQVADEEF